MSADVVIAATDGGIRRLVLNRPDKRNALNAELIAALKAALRQADADESVSVVAIEGAGKDFCSGADLSALRKIAESSAMENLEDVDELAELFLLPRRMRKPVVACVRGRALAGGCGLATACDLVLASETAEFGYPEVKIGFVPAMVMAILRRNVSEKRAFELVVRGQPVAAAEAERIGLINQVWPDTDFDRMRDEYLADLAKRSASAVQLSKRLLYHADGMGFEAALRSGADVNVVARMTDDMKAGVARFLERG
ncbi:enoyl-CoA hydratase/isomerase family protein [Longimicrobium sp.]|uniref:enoyl-CoA hydratase/isomerase family protein n=1 Tax=Longimicrobium sp. TaxID=2029185 RepID=UPI002E34222B|nr:enoyl-CoA hydratase-related protein [Longimicrobium sp.]HEX6039559.1 enoyl-CoA hydratase-related protein [Longimicrobium sp.]